MRRAARLCVAAALIAVGCGGGEERVEQPGDVPGDATGDVSEAASPPTLHTVPAETARGIRGPDGEPFEVTLRTPGGVNHLHREIGRRLFALPLRTSTVALTQYPCGSCHEGAAVRAGAAADAHEYVRPAHPAEGGTECGTCHAPDSVSRLRVPGGETVSLDHAYRLCRQCHSPQVRDWAAGAHGKRIDAWLGRRVVMNCADCHDPHRPALEKRIPYPGPGRIPRTGGDGQ